MTTIRLLYHQIITSFSWFCVLLLIAQLPLHALVPDSRLTTSYDGDRAWLIRGAYNRQSECNFLEVGIGRMNSLYSNSDAGLSPFRVASIGFTLGGDFSASDTSIIFAPKLGIEAALTFIGARISYGYYQQDGNASGVIGFEGGINILSVFFIYGGYNFVKGNADNPVIESGLKFSAGLNLPLFPKPIPPSKRLGKD